MSYKVYLYEKCSTCQKALRFLEQAKISCQMIDIVKTPPSIEELKKMLGFQNHEIKKLFNTSGILYREMQLSEKLTSMTQNEALELLSQHGMLVKRPFLLGKDIGLVGFREAQWNSLLAR